MDSEGRTSSQPLVTRRTALRGAAIGAATVWVAPAVQAVSMTTAHAASAPPGGVRPPRSRPAKGSPGRPVKLSNGPRGNAWGRYGKPGRNLGNAKRRGS
jgi:hypothetical protein